MNYTDRITSIKGIGDKTAKLFEKISVYTVRDLLDHFPRDYEEFGPPVKAAEAPQDLPVTLELTVLSGFQWKKVRPYFGCREPVIFRYSS